VHDRGSHGASGSTVVVGAWNGPLFVVEVDEVVGVVKGWRTLASSLRLSSDDVERMAPAFRVADAT